MSFGQWTWKLPSACGAALSTSSLGQDTDNEQTKPMHRTSKRTLVSSQWISRREHAYRLLHGVAPKLQLFQRHRLAKLQSREALHASCTLYCETVVAAAQVWTGGFPPQTSLWAAGCGLWAGRSPQCMICCCSRRARRQAGKSTLRYLRNIKVLSSKESLRRVFRLRQFEPSGSRTL